jgi:hypothetical protein
VISPSRWLRAEGANKEEPYPITSQVLALGEEKVKGLQHANTQVGKGACARTRPWSYGSVKLTLGVKFLRVSFYKELWIRVFKGFSRQPKKLLWLKESLERS